ncbi:MAG: MerR family transcriptional regulator, partial [Candidatus Helarchaeota archaeon]
MPPYLTISEAALLLGVCPKTLRRWDRAGFFKPAFRTAGQHRRYDLVHIKAFTNAHRPSLAAR